LRLCSLVEMAVVIDFQDDDSYIEEIYSEVKDELDLVKRMPIVPSQINFMDEIVETSTFVPGTVEDPPDHDLFVVSCNMMHSGGTIDAIRECILSLGDLGNVVDFGAGVHRRYCDTMEIIEHVEWKEYRSTCTCGCGVTPYATPFYKHSQLKTFVAINSLQNNSYSFVQKMLNQLVVYDLDFLIIQPTKLGKDEIDCEHLIFSTFVGVKRFLIGEGSMVVFHYNQQKVVAEIHEAALSETEICVSMAGYPVIRTSDHVKCSVLVYGVSSHNEISIVDAGDGSVCDFLVAGHITFGETPYQTAIREWSEEMLTKVPIMEYYGILHPPISIAKAYVFVVRTDGLNLKCAPSRGFVRSLLVTDKCRNDFYPALRALNRYFSLPKNFNLDLFCSSYYERLSKRKVKDNFIAKYGSNAEYKKISKSRGAGAMWNSIYYHYKADFNRQCRIQVEDLKAKFQVDMRSTNQSAVVHAQLQIGELVILCSDTNTPCPFINLNFEGRAVGYAVYAKTFQDKRIYRVQHVIPNYYSSEVDKNKVNYLPRMLNYAKEPYAVKVIDQVTASSILGYVEFTDTDLGARKLARFKKITVDEATVLIRDLGYYGVNL
jgi:hypothetical protein